MWTNYSLYLIYCLEHTTLTKARFADSRQIGSYWYGTEMVDGNGTETGTYGKPGK